MASKAEGNQEQHLRPLREIGVQAVIVPYESVVPPIAQDIPQVIAGAIGAHFGRHGIEEVVDEKYAK
jgi:hypothetical protein